MSGASTRQAGVWDAVAAAPADTNVRIFVNGTQVAMSVDNSLELAGRAAAAETVLIVCTANQCRSPLAAALLRRALDGSGVAVLDAGTGPGGYPVTDETSIAATRLGVDLADHVSTTVDSSLVDAADLIITMERAHVRTIAAERPEAWSKTFTLKELVRRAEEAGSRPSGQSLAEWLTALHEGRNRRDLLGASSLDDVADPTTDRRVDHDSIAEELDALVRSATDLVWPDVTSG